MRIETFEQAQAAVLAWALPRWDEAGSPHVLASGQEDDWYFRVVLGAREWLVDKDLAFAPTDEPVTLVDKATGAVSQYDWQSAAPGLALMRPAGEAEIADEVGPKQAKALAQKHVEARLARRKASKRK